MTLSPKIRFQANVPAARAHSDLVLSSAFIEAIQAALLEFSSREGTSYDPVKACALHHRMSGARDFVHDLLNLSEVPKPKTIDTTQNLKHTN